MNPRLSSVNRRVPALVLAALTVLAGVVWGRDQLESEPPTFASVQPNWMPAAPLPGSLTESWFCPGAPAGGGTDQARIDIVNRTAEPLAGQATVVNDAGDEVDVALNVTGWGRQSIDLDETLPGAMVATFVEVTGGGAVVEQYSSVEKGDSVLVCATETSSNWYLADGYTVGGSSETIVIANPYDYPAVATIEFSTAAGIVDTQQFSGLQVPARGVRVVELNQASSGAQDEKYIGVSVNATRGRLVVGRVQSFTDERGGAQVTLAAPATRDQWWFPGTAVNGETTQQFSLYNPGSEEVEADLIVFGSTVQPDSIEVPPKSVVPFDLSTLTDLGEGFYTVVVSTANGQSLVVERTTTTKSGGTTGTAVLMGAPPRRDGFIATSWIVGVAPSEPTAGGLVIHNADLVDGAFTVYAVTPTGPVPIPGLDSVELPQTALVSVDLTDALAVGQQVVVSSNTRVFVERSLPSGRGDLRTVAWAVPVLAVEDGTGS